MLILWVALLALTLALVAFVAAMIGIGGGVLYTPLQIFFGIDIHEAATTSLFLIMALSMGATAIYRRASRIDWAMALVFEMPTVLGGFSGGYLSAFLSARFLTILLALTLLLVGLSMLKGSKMPRIPHHACSAWYCWRREKNGERYAINLPIALTLCFLAGSLSGLVGVGGGIIKVPLMAIVLGVPIDIAIATSSFMVGITAAGGFAGHLIAGHWAWQQSLIFAPGVLAGAMLGAHTMLSLDKQLLKRIFGALMLVIALVLAVKIFLA